MCGRFTLRAPASVVAEQFAVLVEPDQWRPRYNIAPSQTVAAVRAAAALASGRERVWLRWGLIPAWAEDPAIGNRLINARAESVADKPAFRAALRSRRCLVGTHKGARNNLQEVGWTCGGRMSPRQSKRGRRSPERLSRDLAVFIKSLSK
jgi:hypothetical protein